MLYFAAVIILFVEKMNRYYEQYLDFLDSGPSPVPDMLNLTCFCFCFWQLLFRWNMICVTTWKTVGWLMNSSFHLFMAKQWDATDFSTFSDFSNFWTMTMLLTSWMKHIHNITLLLNIWLWTKLEYFSRGWIIFKHYIHKKHECFGIKIHKLSDMSGYTCDMDIYSGEDRTCVTRDMTATHATVKWLT
jgi:hypothetical protein